VTIAKGKDRLLIEIHLCEEVKRAQMDCGLAAARAEGSGEEKRWAMDRLELALRRLARCIAGGTDAPSPGLE
jgi:hypothetical protein